jgi:CRP-like cAMP-binding protein
VGRSILASEHLDNQLLAALPSDVFSAIQPSLVHVEFKLRTVLYNAEDEVDWVYFPRSGMISLLHVLDDSRGIEIATIGNEGVLGAMAGFGLHLALSLSVVQVHLNASKISATNFRRLAGQHAPIRDLAIRYNEVLLAQTQVTAACNALHAVEQRFCRWLLQTSDRANSDQLSLTQEFLAEMLGVRRTSVTEIARRLQAAGLIQYRRGLVTLVDRQGLENLSCSCLGTVRRLQDRLMSQTLR